MNQRANSTHGAHWHPRWRPDLLQFLIMANPRFCEQCGSALTATARFCPECGVALAADAVSVAAPSGAASRAPVSKLWTWLVPALAGLAVIAVAVTFAPAPAAPAVTPASDGIGGTAPDISSLTPDERVDRLFNRVMAAAAAGKKDTVDFFAPMAVNAFAALGPLDAHRRYDLGLIYLVAGEAALARAASDTILAAVPTHLLGLALAMRAAGAAGDAPARRRFATRFLDRLASERARALQEYVDHATDIDEAIAEANRPAPVRD